MMNMRQLSTFMLVANRLLTRKTDPGEGFSYYLIAGEYGRPPGKIVGGPISRDVEWLGVAGYIEFGRGGLVHPTVRGREFIQTLTNTLGLRT